MILDTNSADVGNTLRADLCIVGAGAAGITIARYCSTRGLSVIMVESGGRSSTAASELASRGDVVNPALHSPAHHYRRRCLGGSTTVWGGRCVPFDRLDFLARPWLGLHTPWPITFDDLKPYWADAAALLDIGEPDFQSATAIRGGMQPMFPAFHHSNVATNIIERFSCPTDFGKTFGPELSTSRSIMVLLHAECTGILMDDDHRRIQEVEVKASGGHAIRVRSDMFVLACGGLEVPHLLLANNRQAPTGIGNGYGQVGRNYMCHIAGTTGLFTAGSNVRPWHGYERDNAGIYCRRRLSIKPEAQQAMRIGNAAVRLHHPRVADPSHRSGSLSALYLAHRLLPQEYASRFASDDSSAAALRHAVNVLRDLPATAAFIRRLVCERVVARRKYPSITIMPRADQFTLEVHAEQLPNPNSRILLGSRRDRFGIPELRIDWHYREADLRTVRVTVALIADALSASGHGSLQFDPDQIDLDMLRDGAYGGHHLGGARMSASARTGVVNSDCRVHDLANLYVAGGAVFPTSGQANPTFTIVALAVRLAGHLVRTSAARRSGGHNDVRASGSRESRVLETAVH